MLITILKDVIWSIDYKAVPFRKNENIEIKDDIAKEMIKYNYAIETIKKQEIEIPESILINKIQNSSIQNVDIETIDKKKGRPRKIR